MKTVACGYRGLAAVDVVRQLQNYLAMLRVEGFLDEKQHWQTKQKIFLRLILLHVSGWCVTNKTKNIQV